MSASHVDEDALPAVLAAYGHAGAATRRVAGGLINATYLVGAADPPALVVQRLHPVFAAEVNLDLEAVTDHLAARGLVTPRLVRTTDGEAWVRHAGATWRALTYVDGVAHARVPDPAHARAAGELVGRFHRALGDYQKPFHFQRAGVHDTAAHLARLAGHLDATAVPGADPLAGDARALGDAICDAAADLEPLADLPRRVCHGDLKISNVLFAPGETRALCLIDLDTLGHQLIAHELGDALRSWCNPVGEDSDATRVDLAIAEAALSGYGAGAPGLLSADEAASIPLGLETICVELAARFCVDVFEDRYFGWDPARFPSRRHHNLVRARGQLALALAVHDERGALARLARRATGA